MTLRAGRFGPYVQLGEAVNGEKPKRAGLPKGMPPDDIDLDRALALLSLPREVGRHPETASRSSPASAGSVPTSSTARPTPISTAGDDVLTIGLNRAVTLIAEKKAKGPRKGRFGADPGRALGDHPDKGGPVVVKNGRYGPYVSHDGVNATLPSDMTPETITLEQAVALLDARAAARRRQEAAKLRAKGRREQGVANKPQPTELLRQGRGEAAQHRTQGSGEAEGRAEAAGQRREEADTQSQGRHNDAPAGETGRP